MTSALLFILFTGLMVAAFVWMNKAAAKATRETVRIVGSGLGLTPPAGSARTSGSGRVLLHGTWEGYPANLHTILEGRQKHRRSYVRLEIGVPNPRALFLSIRPASGPGFIQDALRGKDISTGDPDFDRLFHVSGSNSSIIASALTPDLRADLVGFFNTAGNGLLCGNFIIERNAVLYSQRGTPSAEIAERAVVAAPFLPRFARIVEAYSAS